MNITYNPDREIKIWLKRNGQKPEILKIIHEVEPGAIIDCYHIYPAFDNHGYNFGRILFDSQGYWIYDGEDFTIGEQEQIASFIINNKTL